MPLLRTSPASGPEHLPARVYQAVEPCVLQFREEAWDALAVSIRGAIRTTLAERDARGGTLREGIDDLAERGVLPLHMKEWAYELRELAVESDGGAAGKESSQGDVEESMKFLWFLLDYVYYWPHRIQGYRERRSGA